MTQNPRPAAAAADAVPFGDLLATTIGAVVQAQEQLDEYALRRREAYESTPPGQLGLPPLSYVFNAVAVELELSATVSGTRGGDPAAAGAGLLCRTLNPTMVGLYGYQASAGVRVRLLMEPRGPLPIRVPDEPAAPTP